jgi:hypothetical protein
MDTLPWFRSTIHDAGLEATVIGVVGPSTVIATHWRTPLGLLFIDGGHAEEVAMADYESWSRWVAPSGYLAVHDVFEDPAEGGQAPYRMWLRARDSDDFEPQPALGCGSLRVLRRSD